MLCPYKREEKEDTHTGRVSMDVKEEIRMTQSQAWNYQRLKQTRSGFSPRVSREYNCSILDFQSPDLYKGINFCLSHQICGSYNSHGNLTHHHNGFYFLFLLSCSTQNFQDNVNRSVVAGTFVLFLSGKSLNSLELIMMLVERFL